MLAGGMDTMTIDCGRCAVRGGACGDCVVQVLLGPATPARLTADEQAAVAVLAERRMVPPLRLVPTLEPRAAWPEQVERLRACG